MNKPFAFARGPKNEVRERIPEYLREVFYVLCIVRIPPSCMARLSFRPYRHCASRARVVIPPG